MSLTVNAAVTPRPAAAATPPPAAAVARVARVATRRNVPVDILRGYCIVMMVTSHTGTNTWLNTLTHPLRFVSGAEGFVFLSGLVLGMVYRRKLDAAPARHSYRVIWRRAGLLWLVHCLTVFAAMAANAGILHFGDIPSVQQVGWRALIVDTLTLRFQPGHLLNILPLYVFLLAAAPLAFELLRRGKTLVLLAASVALFVYTQFEPGLGSWVDRFSGGDAFPPFAWQGLFLPAMVIGYHSALIRSTVLARWRRVMLWSLVPLCLAVIVLVSVQTPTFGFYDHVRWDLFLWERHPLRFGRVLYFLLAVSSCYLAVQALWHRARLPRIPRMPLEMLATLGRNSLYAFLVHLAFAFALGALQVPPEHWLLAELAPLTAVAGVYVMARYQVARRWIPN